MNDDLRAIPGYEDFYAASSDGRIWSYRTRRWLRTYLTNGYERVDLVVAYKANKARVHRLVALAWVENPNGLPEVNHLDGNKRHNAAANLEWCAHSENLRHALRTGLRKAPLSGARLSLEQVAAIKAMLPARTRSLASIARAFGVAASTIERINNGTAWRGVAPAQTA